MIKIVFIWNQYCGFFIVFVLWLDLSFLVLLVLLNNWIYFDLFWWKFIHWTWWELKKLFLYLLSVFQNWLNIWIPSSIAISLFLIKVLNDNLFLIYILLIPEIIIWRFLLIFTLFILQQECLSKALPSHSYCLIKH